MRLFRIVLAVVTCAAVLLCGGQGPRLEAGPTPAAPAALAPASPTPTPTVAQPPPASPDVVAAPADPGPLAPGAGRLRDLLSMVAFAFLGGLILNIMPCVLPVISLKILGFVNQAASSPQRVRQLGLIYALGVVVSLLLMGCGVIALKQAGKAVSWGIQFGNPQFIVVLMSLVTLVALNLFGVFEVTLGNEVTGSADEWARKEGGVGAFFNGVLAVILATPCTAPFLGVAIGFALPKSAAVILLIFFAAALGLASPYVLLSWNSSLLRLLPRPGAWMERFKVAMGFPMLATVVWLFKTALRLFGDRVSWLGFFLVLVSACAWIYGQFVQRGNTRRPLALAVIVALLFFGYSWMLESGLHWRSKLARDVSQPSSAESGEIAWKPWSLQAIQAARLERQVVFVDFTAEWCPNCKANRASSIEVPSVIAKLKELNALPLIADYTATPDDMTEEIVKWGRGGIPLVLVYPRNPGLPPKALPEILTPSIVLAALEEAAKP
ncbi:MAG: thioredoxin family protein [Verrucomicrobia bacterium]|nr:thioredoxin family protein [Verrucomicrobiota bacterium]